MADSALWQKSPELSDCQDGAKCLDKRIEPNIADYSEKDPATPCSEVGEKITIIEDIFKEGPLPSQPEYPIEVSSKVGRAQWHHSQKELLLEKERKSGSVDVRSSQALIHSILTHTRIDELEKELKKLKHHVHNNPEDPNAGKSRMLFPVHKREIRRSTIDRFKITHQTYNTPVEERPVLEILVSIDPDKLAAQQQLDLRSDKSDDPYLTASQTPEKLRIRSPPLLQHLENVTGEDVEVGFRNDDDDRMLYPGTVFLRPFKLFVKHEKRIRQSFVDLQSELDKKKALNSPHTESKKRSVGAYDLDFEDEDLLQDLKLLVQFIDVHLKPTFDLRHSIAEGTATHIEYGDLWHLFDHGLIVVDQSSEMRAYRVISFTGGREPLIDMMQSEEDRTPALDGFAVNCISLAFNGSDYVPRLHRFTISKFGGQKPISSLAVYPLALHPSGEVLRNNLQQHAKRFLDITSPPFSHYVMTGKTLDEPSHDVDAQVIVDMAVAFNTVGEWRPSTKVEISDLAKPDKRETFLRSFCKHYWQNNEGCCGDDTIFKDLKMDQLRLDSYLQNHSYLLGPRKRDELAEDDLILLPDQVHGYILRNRQWITMKVADLSEVEYQDNFNELMLPERHKTSILALVKTHENARGERGVSVGAGLDMVKGKGTGLILLLHGEPGVGKTSTAECVADNTKRPLYPITCGDIGETAMDVERNLLHNFSLAHKWGCVLLLDEADVFLAKRSKTDLRRNAVTSVFLRSLEYYAGILFLTTNRVGSIDPAFKSRIHMSLFYPRLKKEDTVKLYEVFIRRAKAEQERLGAVTFKINKKEITKFAKQHFREMEREGLGTWNGRQIRNAFQAAIALVEHESQQTGPGAPKPTLGAAQFQSVAESSKEFDRYLITTLGAADSDIAMREEWRADRFPTMDQSRMEAMATSRRPYNRKHGSKKVVVESDTDTSTESDDSENDTSGDNSG
ncbi:uncharacterized protein JN550_012285 [Neoarthrinium moseri]|nr:uncharacterized protein JN550_012285 [Neoarthrinium moseri]KAI1858927.1 hypothetical protein JN550_012285 [Neoarthrinium moseri]